MTPPECELVENPRKDKTCRFSQESSVRAFVEILSSNPRLLHRFANAVYQGQRKRRMQEFYALLANEAVAGPGVDYVCQVLGQIDGIRQSQYSFSVSDAVAGILEACFENVLARRCGADAVRRCVYITINGERVPPVCNVDVGTHWNDVYELYECKVRPEDLILRSRQPSRQLRFLKNVYHGLNQEGQACYTCVASFKHSTQMKMALGSEHPEISLVGRDSILSLAHFPPDSTVTS